jgi:hypothetical protein
MGSIRTTRAVRLTGLEMESAALGVVIGRIQVWICVALSPCRSVIAAIQLLTELRLVHRALFVPISVKAPFLWGKICLRIRGFARKSDAPKYSVSSRVTLGGGSLRCVPASLHRRVDQQPVVRASTLEKRHDKHPPLSHFQVSLRRTGVCWEATPAPERCPLTGSLNPTVPGSTRHSGCLRAATPASVRS